MGEKSREKKERREGDFIEKKEEVAEGATPILWWIIFIGVALILFTPFLISPKYFFPFVGFKSIYFMALAEIIFAAWLILITIAPKYRPRLNILTFVVILFLVVSILSSIFGVDFSRSFWSKYERMTGLSMLLHLCGFFLVVSSVFRKKEDWFKILGISVFAAILMSFISFYPKALGDIASLTRGGATLGNSSFLGTYLLFNFFFAIYLFFRSEKFTKILSLSGVIIIGIALYLSTARAALLSTLIGLILLFLLWLVFNQKRKLKLVGISLCVILLILAATSVFLISRPGNFLNKIVSDIIGENFGGRFVVWEGAWRGLLDKPFLGWGLENFEISFTRYFNSCMLGPNCGGDIWYDRAHNIIFDTLVANGAIGMASYLGIFLVVFYVLWKKFFRGEIGIWAAGIFSVVLIAYFIQNLTVFDMINSYTMFFLVLGFVGNIAGKEDESHGAKRNPNMLMVATILILFVFSLSTFALKPLKADGYIINSLAYPLGSQQRLDYYQKALETSQVGKYQIRDFFAQSTMDLIQAITDQSTVSAEGLKKELDFIIGEMEKSIEESPMDFRAFLKLGQLYNIDAILVGNISPLIRAEEVLKKAVELSPTNQQGYWTLAQTDIYQGKLSEAFSLAKKAVNLEPKVLQSHLIVIQIAKIMGDDDLAQQKAQDALKINPSWQVDINNILNK